MKTKTIKLFGIIMMLIMGMSFNACSSDDDGDDDGGGGSGQKGNLVGNWYFEEDDFEMLWVVKSNGQFKCIEREFYNGKAEDYVYYGTWTYYDDKLIMRDEYGEVAYCTIRWINSNKIELTNDEDYDECTLSRVSYSTLPDAGESGNDDNEYSMKNVCGLYYREDDGMDLYLFDDGYCELMSYDRYGDVSDEASGSYSIEGDELILRIKWDSSSKYVTEEWRIVSLSSKAMVLDIDGEHYTFELIQKF